MPSLDESGNRVKGRAPKRKKSASGKNSSGLYDYGTKGDLKKAAREAAIRRSKNRKPTGGYKGFDTAGAINKEYSANQKSNKRKADSAADTKMGAYRRGRVKQGAFKGNYYGPDAFKGDLAKVDAWRKAGGKKSDIAKFAKRGR